MDIAALSTGMSQSKLAMDIGVALVGLSKDVMTQQAAVLQTLITSAGATTEMERSVSPELGGNIDIRI